MIQEIDIKGMMIDMIEEIDIVEKDQGHLEIIILEGYRGRSNSKTCSFCGKIGHNIKVCWDFQKYLEKIGRQLTKMKR